VLHGERRPPACERGQRLGRFTAADGARQPCVRAGQRQPPGRQAGDVQAEEDGLD
jgi:hypothetical protein